MKMSKGCLRNWGGKKRVSLPAEERMGLNDGCGREKLRAEPMEEGKYFSRYL